MALNIKDCCLFVRQHFYEQVISLNVDLRMHSLSTNLFLLLSICVSIKCIFCHYFLVYFEKPNSNQRTQLDPSFASSSPWCQILVIIHCYCDTGMAPVQVCNRLWCQPGFSSWPQREIRLMRQHLNTL